MKISAALAGIDLLGIETSPFIYLVESNPVYVDRARAIFQSITTGKPQAVTSTITLTEVLVMPVAKRHTQYQQAYRNMILHTQHIAALPVNAAIAEQAAHLRANYQLRTPDALHLATAIESACDAFLTNDKNLR